MFDYDILWLPGSLSSLHQALLRIHHHLTRIKLLLEVDE